VIPNDEMNCSSDLLKLYPTKKEIENVMWEIFKCWRYELEQNFKNISDTVNFDQLQVSLCFIGLKLLKCVFLLLLKDIWENYLVKISKEPYGYGKKENEPLWKKMDKREKEFNRIEEKSIFGILVPYTFSLRVTDTVNSPINLKWLQYYQMNKLDEIYY